MQIFKTHKYIHIQKLIGNMRITSMHYSEPVEGSSEWEDYTTINCWYDRDCENCTMGWEERSYEGECDDCGCIFEYDFNVPIWKCMLPKHIKNLIKRRMMKNDS